MNYRKIDAQPGSIVNLNENMSLKYEKIADDLGPVWQEIPPEPSNVEVKEGDFVQVTEDVWFVFVDSQWRMMNHAEHVEASRQVYLNQSKIPDHFSRP